jgi:hypothetical protein
MPRNEQHAAPQVLHQLSGQPITEYEHGKLQEFLAIIRTRKGSTTPVETFLCDLVYAHGRWPLTPDSIRLYFKELEENWTDFIADAAFAIRQYPELVRQQLPEGSVLQTAAEIQEQAEELIRIGQWKAEQERQQSEARAKNTADVARAEHERAVWRTKHPDFANRVDAYMDWVRSLDTESLCMAAGEPFRLLGESRLREAGITRKKAPHSGKRGARESSTLDQKAGTLSGSGYQVINEPKPVRPEMSA